MSGFQTLRSEEENVKAFFHVGDELPPKKYHKNAPFYFVDMGFLDYLFFEYYHVV